MNATCLGLNETVSPTADGMIAHMLKTEGRFFLHSEAALETQALRVVSVHWTVSHGGLTSRGRCALEIHE